MLRLRIPLLLGSIIFCACQSAVEAQTGVRRDSFLIKPERPVVYLHVDHVGLGGPEEGGKRRMRVWLELENNCALPISVKTQAAPMGDTVDAVSIEEVLVKNDELVISSSQPSESASNVEPMPSSGYVEVGSRHTIPPGASLRFSLPASHFSKHWTIHIPFQFDLPEGNDLRDDNAWGGQPMMFLSYSFYDLPMAVQKSLNETPNR